jgi:hypothetical protein
MRNCNGDGALHEDSCNQSFWAKGLTAMEQAATMLDRLVGVLSVIVLWLVPAALGRGVWYAEAIRKGERKLAVSMIAVEAATAIFCAIVGGGAAEYLALGPYASLALIGVVSWLGPNGAYAIAMLVLRRRPGGKG